MKTMRKMNCFVLAALLLGCLFFAGCGGSADQSWPSVIPSQVSASSATATPSPTTNGMESYGVFIGLDPEDMARLSGYELVVIDAAYFSAEQIAQMHDSGQTVYTYLNIGSVERFRDYYKEYEPLTLGVYEDWPDERWVDVSQPEWQDFIVNTLAASLAAKGVDGFFLDNADVYYVYPRDEIYQGLTDILTGLDGYGLPLIINGGDAFVRKLMDDGQINLIDGVNQESVFTSIDFDTETFGTQDAENHEYYLEYLNRCRDAGLKVYLLEYATDPVAVETQIAAYCGENGFQYYISDDLELDG